MIKITNAYVINIRYKFLYFIDSCAKMNKISKYRQKMLTIISTIVNDVRVSTLQKKILLLINFSKIYENRPIHGKLFFNNIVSK